MSRSTLSEWLRWLESCHPTEIDLGLDRIAAVAGRLKLDLGRSRVVTVGGTNGKGSCVAALQALCIDAGVTVGAYTSPHLLRYNERICLQGQPVSDALLMSAFERVFAALQGQSLTYFEFGTLAALLIFQQQSPDIVILEVGLGGRLDAVNIIDADVSVVTSIALDHEAWLGSDREAIGFEKAGIFRPGRPAVCADPSPPASVTHWAEQIGAGLLLRGRDFDLEIGGGNGGGSNGSTGHDNWRSGDTVSRIPGISQSSLPQQSIAAALQVAHLLGIPQCHWTCLSGTSLPGRFQRISYRGRSLLLDVAHNPEASGLLAERLEWQPCGGRRLALFAVMADKDIRQIIEILGGSFDEWWIASLPEVPRAASAGVVSAIAREVLSQPVEEVASVSAALCEALARMAPADELVVFGSFFTVAAVLERVETESPVANSPAEIAEVGR